MPSTDQGDSGRLGWANLETAVQTGGGVMHFPELNADGQNLIQHQEQGYTILVFAHVQKNRNGVTVPFTCLGPVDMVSYESERPIKRCGGCGIRCWWRCLWIIGGVGRIRINDQ